MPAYDFRCPEGHVVEKFLSFSKMEETGGKAECGHVDEDGVYCTLEGEYSPSFWYCSPTETERRVQAAQRFKPVVIHRDAQGNIRYPGSADAPVPPGFEKVELTDFYHIRKFEKEVNERDRVRAQQFANSRDQFLSGQLAENRRVMDNLVKNFTPRGRKFYEKMREVSESRRLKGRATVTPEFYVEAFSKDASNREGYSDARNDWGRMHGNGK